MIIFKSCSEQRLLTMLSIQQDSVCSKGIKLSKHRKLMAFMILLCFIALATFNQFYKIKGFSVSYTFNNTSNRKVSPSIKFSILNCVNFSHNFTEWNIVLLIYPKAQLNN